MNHLKVAISRCGLVACILLVAGCGGEEVPLPSEEEAPMSIQITSSAFVEGGAIPAQYTCDGEDMSPPLAWSGAPDGTKSFALINDDPDAPGTIWVHWVLYDLPPETTQLAENLPKTGEIPGGGTQGKSSFGQMGYGGPCPPGGTHRYYFRLYALDALLNLEPGATKPDLLKAMEGHVLAQGQLMGTYQRR